MAINVSITAPISPSASKRFYEAVIFLYCLIQVNYNNGTTTEPDLETATGKAPKDEFFCFVNKLAQICDSECGGDTITAFSVLQPGSIQYRFTSNNRSDSELDTVREYVTDILNTLGQAPDEQLDTIREDILGRVIKFNRPRIEHYIGGLLKEVDFCIQACENVDTNGSQTAARNLQSIQELAISAADESLTNEQFAASAVALLNTISTLYTTPFGTFIRQKSRHDSDPNSRTPWSDLRHHLGRLESYSLAITVLLAVRRHRQSLFEDFTVHPVPSMPEASPPNIRRSADGIMQRMPAVIKTTYRACAAHLAGLGIDKAIKKRAEPSEFKPIVHCEINLFDSILRDNSLSEDDEPLPFYEEATFGRYIGCSKPTCRLCALYFSAHPTEVKVRPSHSNVYYKWRAPDVYKSEGQHAKKQREDILETMIKQLRNVIQEGLSGIVKRKAHDSNSTPSNPYPYAMSIRSDGRIGIAEESLAGDVDGDDLAPRLGEMGL
ncbi:hypothetical protein V8F33_013773 [Rhypophila sp. PSN 637]